MGKMYMFFTMLSLAMFSFSCYENNNPLDENGTNYIPPKITINEDASSVKNFDTVHFDSIVIVLEGNHERSLFNLKMDGGEWANEWKSEGTFGFGRLSDGKHTMYINSMYREGNIVVSDSLVFRVLTKGYKPGFSATKDTTIKLFEGNSVTLSVQAEGRSPLNYSWFKGASVLEGKNSDTLQINSFTVNDSASYKCIVTNEYGKAASRLFILKYRPFSGGVKGIVTDLSGNKLENASVTLLPSNKNNSTDTAGLFAFSSLSRNTYTLKISLPQYHDMTLSEIAVNDSETIVLPTIILKMIASATYEVTYNGNGSDGGTVPVDTAHYKQGNRIAVAAIGDLSKAGYSFTNWNMKRDGSGDSFAPGDSFTIRDAVTFHAQWTALPVYKITYNRNGADTGTVPIASNSYYRGKEVTVAGNPGNLHKEGYSFSGWNLKTDGTGETYNAGGKFSMPDSAVTLYVKWTTNPTWSIIYHDNTSTGGAVPAVVTTDSGTTITIADSGSLYKTGYTFVEWNTKEDGSGKAYKTGDNFIIGNLNIDLYAQWTKAQFTITYHGNGNTSGEVPAKIKCLYQSEISIAGLGDLSKTGYSFVSWNTDSTGNGLDFQEGNKITIVNDTHLFAKWIKKKFRITFAGNGTMVNKIPADTQFTYGARIDSLSVVPLRQSYTFNGWYRDTLCTAKWEYANDSVIADDTLYAQWLIKDVDGNIYTEVKIGEQVWMVENLKVTKYNDGTTIPLVENNENWATATAPAYCWYDNTESNKNLYGALYNWYAIDTNSTHQIAPEGWHVPSLEEWNELTNYLDAENLLAKPLASTAGWNTTDIEGAPGKISTNNNSSGFSALPGGMRQKINGEYFGKGIMFYLWFVDDLKDNTAWASSIYYDREYVGTSYYNDKEAGAAVRCVRNR